MITNNQRVNNEFSTILLSVKNMLEQHFNELIKEMEEDPLDGLYTDKLPTGEEIFFEEWSNDRFPKVYIPVIGGYIEEVGARIVGDIDLDGIPPEADLNISSVNNPSELSLEQCQAIWDRSNGNSLVTKYPSLWFEASKGDISSILHLKSQFNLTEKQINHICNWINVGKSTWIKYLSQERITVLNPLFYGLFIPGIVLGGFGTYKMIPEIRNIRKSDLDKIKKKEHISGK